MLPESKYEFPKCIYLDQNKWIDLARAHYGLKEGVPFKEALESLSSAVAAGKVLVPMSCIHVMETVGFNNSNGRRRLAKFMVELSDNLFIVPHINIRRSEIAHAVLKVLGLNPQTSLRAQVLQRGISFAFGVQPMISEVTKNITKQLEAIISSKEFSVEFLVNGINTSVSRNDRKVSEEILEILEEIRGRVLSKLTPDMQLGVEFHELFTKGSPGQEMRQVLKNLNITLDNFMQNFRNHNQYLSFFQTVSTMDVFVKLKVAMDKEKHRRIHRNDTKDMVFLCVAVPYCNAIITERFLEPHSKNNRTCKPIRNTS